MDFLDHASSINLGERALFEKDNATIFLNKNCEETVSNDVIKAQDNLNGNKLTINVAESFSRQLLKNCENFANFVEATTSNAAVYESFIKQNPDHVLVGNQLKMVRIESQIQSSSGCNFPNYTLCFDGTDMGNGFKNEVNHENVNSNSIEWYSFDDNQMVKCIDLSKQSTSLDHFSIHCESEDFSTKEIHQVQTQNAIEDIKDHNKDTSNFSTESDDDVVFVKEYKLPVISPQVDNADVPKRRNPKRKVQLEKASVDLINKLTIPPSVFNARVRKSTRKPVPTKKCRRSNRLTKLISNPLSPLNRSDIRDWPDDGMHERPVYNETTNSIDKLDPFLKTKQTKILNKENQSPTMRKPSKKSRRKKNVTNKKRKEQKEEVDLSFLVHERLQLILGYISQMKIYENVVNNKNSCVSDGAANQKQFPFAYELLTDASVLYSIVNGVEQADLAKYLTSVDSNEALNFLNTYFTNLDDSDNHK